MVGRYSAYRRGPDPVVSPALIDRILIGACAAVWLVLIGVSVAAAVALADLGRGFHKMTPHTTWVLYAVIIVSALIIVGAIPVLLRARRMPRDEPVVRSKALQGSGIGRQPLRPGRSAARSVTEPARRASVKTAAAGTEWSGEAVDRVWLRGTLALTGTIGIALIAVASATYLMAVGHDGASWVGYGLAGAITAGLPVIEWLHVRQIRRVASGH
ncbi:DUF2561 family protein [Mycobacterium angelicum]|uniref:DUF2561 domain-containing protein n=1 Tax=Mycobacterium angelicum TaxID=470074 RepID=A0A1W9ZFR9_MYCAN|nr:DUF2561 family protein [Mycobacterium angelicum]MCV7195824.1 DUF2561 family protein [Mycobacterium angelicum]ORA13960.1 hypothetical protein BST12_23250 [Mycobacterium angelicum]